MQARGVASTRAAAWCGLPHDLRTRPTIGRRAETPSRAGGCPAARTRDSRPVRRLPSQAARRTAFRPPFPAALGTAPAPVDAALHVPDPVTARRARPANPGAGLADMPVLGDADQHEWDEVRPISAQAIVRWECPGSTCLRRPLGRGSRPRRGRPGSIAGIRRRPAAFPGQSDASWRPGRLGVGRSLTIMGMSRRPRGGHGRFYGAIYPPGVSVRVQAVLLATRQRCTTEWQAPTRNTGASRSITHHNSRGFAGSRVRCGASSR